MRTAALREELRERDVLIEADGLTLHVDAPAGALTGRKNAGSERFASGR